MSKEFHAINKRGLLNIKKVGVKNNFDPYHFLMRVSWWQFFVLMSVLYLCLNSFFAFLYYLIPNSIANAEPVTYWKAFVFSFQTSATIGYGHLRPQNDWADLVVILDTLAGFVFFAMTTGSIFSRYSRPTARVIFSKNILLTTFNKKRTLMFRLGNKRTNQIVDADITVSLSWPEVTEEGISIRRFHNLELLRNHSPLFSLSWTVMHIVDEKSPLYRFLEKGFAESGVYFVVSLKGLDDVYMQTVHDRYVYYGEDLVYDKKFVDIIETSENGGLASTQIDYSKFHSLE